MTNLLPDLRVAFRFFNRHRGTTAVIVLTLALALAANTAAFAVVRAFLLSSLGVPQSDRLHIISQVTNTGGLFLDMWPNYLLLREQVKSFDGVAAVLSNDYNWGEGDDVRRVSGAVATASFFRTMRVTPVLGREFTEKEQGPSAAAVAVISHRVWRSAFGGSPDVLAKTMRLNGRPHAIIGVMPEGFGLPPDVDVWLPLDLPKDIWTRGRWLLVFGRLADGVSAAAAQEELKAFAHRAQEANPANKDWGYSSQPARNFILSGANRTIWLVQAGAAVLLLLAATNLSSLLLAWVAEQNRETAVRLALGAAQKHLLRQQLTQSALLMLAGGGLGFLFALATLPLLRELNPAPTLAFFLGQLRLDPAIAAFNLGVALITGLTVGLVPLWQARRTDIVTALKMESRGGTATRGALRWQKAMVVAQSAITALVVSAAVLAVAGFRRATQSGPGYATEGRGVFRVQLPDAQYPDHAARANFMRAFVENLANEPELTAAGASTVLPFGDLPAGAALTVELPSGEFTRENELFTHRRISPGYLPAMGIPLIEGRHINAEDTAERPHVAVISKALATRYWPGASPLGKRFRRVTPGVPPVDITIVGVVGTVRDNGNTEAARLGQTLYVPFAQNSVRKFSVVVQGRGGIEAAIAAGARVLRRTTPTLAAYDVTTLEKLAWQANATPRLQMVLLTSFAAVATLVAALGSYGVMSQLVNNRSREMAVRLAVGGSPGGVLRLILGQNARLAAAGAALGALGAWAGGNWLQGAVTGIDTKAPGIYLAVLVATLLLTQLASFVPARRAAHMDVQRALTGG